MQYTSFNSYASQQVRMHLTNIFFRIGKCFKIYDCSFLLDLIFNLIQLKFSVKFRNVNNLCFNTDSLTVFKVVNYA